MAAGAAMHARRPAGHLQRPAAERQPQSGQRHAAHPDRSAQRDQERQRRVRAGPVDDQPRHHQRRPALGLVHERDVDPETLPASTFNQAVTYDKCPDGKNNLNAGLRRPRHQLEGHQPAHRRRRSTSSATAGRRIKASVARYVNGVGLAAGSITDNNNPEMTVGLTGRAAVARPRRQRIAVRRAPAQLQLDELIAVDVDAELRHATSRARR